MDWEKEQIINRIARRLPKKAYRQKMTVAEWKGYFEMVYDEALIIHGVVSSFCPCGKVTNTKYCNCPDTNFLDDDLH